MSDRLGVPGPMSDRLGFTTRAVHGTRGRVAEEPAAPPIFEAEARA